MNKKNRAFFTEIKDGPVIKLGEATKEQIKNALDIEKQRDKLWKKYMDSEKAYKLFQKELSKTCNHEVFYDEPGMYDIRHCVACGHTSLI